MNKCFLTVLSFLMTLCVVRGQQLSAAFNLRSDLLLHTNLVSKNGLPADVNLEQALREKDIYQFAEILSEHPVFNWEVDTSIAATTAYRILVASSPQLLSKDKWDLWDSKKVTSIQQKASYNGKPLGSEKVYFWKVQIWNEKGTQTPFSQTASFIRTTKDATQLFSHHPLAAQIQQPSQVHQIDSNSYFLDFGKDALGQLQFRLNSNSIDTIWIEVGELADKPFSVDTIPGRNIRYLKVPLVLKTGTYDYVVKWPDNVKRNSRNPILMPSYIGEVYPFRYVSVKNYRGILKKTSVQRKMVFYPFDSLASYFVSSDTILNRVWDLCKYSIKATSFTGYYVDGDRERIPYEADALINQLSHYAVDGEYSMARRTMNYVLYHPTWPTEWSLQNVLLAWHDYLYTGDDLAIKTYYTQLQKKILIELAGADGLISTRTNKQTDSFLSSVNMTKNFDGRRGLHDNVDWPQTGNHIGSEKEYAGETDGFVYNTYNAVVNAYYYRNLVLMQKIALSLNKRNDAKFYEETALRVYNSFQTVFRDAQTGLIKDGDSTDHTSLHANMFALAFGLVRENDREKVVKFIKTRRMACSVYGAQFLLDALYDSGQGQYALELLTDTSQRSWYNMIRSGSTITMEAWDKVYKPNLDLNHAWGAVPANMIVRQMLGIQPLTPGFGSFQIKPQLGNLTSVSLKTPCIKGSISVKYNRDIEADHMEVIIPGGTKADVFVPYSTEKSHLYVNGELVSASSQDGFFVLRNVKAGKHLFKVN